MMVNCFVPGCNHRSDREKVCNFVQFPKDKTIRKKWEYLIRRLDRKAHDGDVVCSCHFKSGDTTLKTPTIFCWNQNKNFDQFKSPEKKKRRRKQPLAEIAENVRPEVMCGGNALAENIRPEIICGDNVLQTQFEELCVSALQDDNSYLSPTTCDVTTQTDSTTILDVSTQTDSPTILHVSTQTDHQFGPVFHEVNAYLYEKRIKELETKPNFGFFVVEGDEKLCLHYTGISLNAFKVLFEIFLLVECEDSMAQLKCREGNRKVTVTKTSEKDQLFLTLVKLRHNFSYVDLGVRFSISTELARKIVKISVIKLHQVLYKCIMDSIPSRHKNAQCLPKCFDDFKNCRIIIDCTEIQCDIPENMFNQKVTYSSYKSRNTFKVLVGCSPNGALTYCSDLYPGSTSDKAVVQHCGILNLMEPGDMIMADKGFTITDLLPEGVRLNIPPFQTDPQFTPEQVYETTKIAQARIHIERVIRRLKGFRITQRIPSSMFSKSTEIIQTCAALVNFQESILKETRELGFNDDE